jgi:phosphoribosylcarboxyaminoimidazole (NCAIR) mutase
LFAAAILALGDPTVAEVLERYRSEQTAGVLASPDPRRA